MLSAFEFNVGNTPVELLKTGVWWSIVTFIIYGLVLRPLYNIYLHPLRNFPGPKLWAAMYLPHTLHLMNGTAVTRIASLHDVYGPVVRWGPNRLSFIESAAFKDIYGVKKSGKSPMPKDPFFYSKPPGQSWDLLNAPDEEIHGRMRRNISHAFSAKALDEQQGIIKGYVDLLIERLRERQGEVLDMVTWYNWTTFDIIGDLAFGEPFGCLRNGDWHPWVRNMFGALRAFGILRAVKQISSVLFPLLIMLVPRSIDEKRRKHMAFGDDKAMARIAKGIDTDRKDFWTYILKYNETKYGLTEGEMKANAGLLVIAGSETTATALSGTTYFLLKYPEVLAKLTAEVRGAFRTEDEINFQSVSSLKYLIACLDEGMRIWPTVAVGLPRRVPKGGDTIAGRFVPGGTTVSGTSLAALRSPKHFRDPETYHPERWLEGHKGFEDDDRSVFYPFSLGTRNCIGKNLATVEMRLILARVLYNFDMELMPENGDWTDQKIFVVWQKKPLMVRLRERKN